ncbi:hypothetical protein Trydic_g16607 [Trypoxylus dichotomus]
MHKNNQAKDTTTRKQHTRRRKKKKQPEFSIPLLGLESQHFCRGKPRTESVAIPCTISPKTVELETFETMAGETKELIQRDNGIMVYGIPKTR